MLTACFPQLAVCWRVVFPIVDPSQFCFPQLAVCRSVIFPFVDPSLFCASCVRSGVTLCIHFEVHCCVFCAIAGYTWSLGILMYLLAAEHYGTAGLLYLTEYHHGTILVTACSRVWDWRVLRAGQCFSVGLGCSRDFCPPLFYLSLRCFHGWLFGVGVFGLREVIYTLIALQCRLPLIIMIIINRF